MVNTVEEKFKLHKKIVILNGILLIVFGILALIFAGMSEISTAIFRAIGFVFLINIGMSFGLLYAIETEENKND